MNNDKDKYRELCNTDKTIPIFSQTWWMDAVCGNNGWDVYIVGEKNDIKASFVYKIDRDNSRRKISRALLTQNNGVYIRYPKGQGIISKQHYEEKVIDEIIDYIESLSLSSYDQQFHWKFQNWLPFFWRHYLGTIKYTYIIEDASDMDLVRSRYSANARNIIKKAKKHVEIMETTDVEMFYDVNKMSFVRQGKPMPYSFEEFITLYKACRINKTGKLLYAKDGAGQACSVAMIVWDDMYVYFLLNGSDPEKKQFQANYLLIDKCIEEASIMGKGFDFEGSVIRSVNHAFREFGGIPTPYFRISKMWEI